MIGRSQSLFFFFWNAACARDCKEAEKFSLVHSLQDITLVLRDILDALNSLHLKNICHGCVHLQSVFVEKRSGEYRGVLDFFPFTNSVSFILW